MLERPLLRALLEALLRVSREHLQNSISDEIPCPDNGSALFVSRMSVQPWIDPGLREDFRVAVGRELSNLRLRSGEIRSSSLYSGWPNFFWTAMDTAATLGKPLGPWLISIGSSPQEFDSKNRNLLHQVQTGDWLGFHELIHGLSGLGIYALRLLRFERSELHTTLVKEVLSSLERISETPESGLRTWFTPKERIILGPGMPRPDSGWFNLGLSHGIPGVIVFLAGCVRAGIDKPRSVRFLRETLAWLHRVPRPEADCRFPAQWIPGLPGGRSRLTWCYGDPGVAASMAIAGQSLSDPDLVSVALDIFEARLTCRESDRGIDDLSLCHGSAGAAFLSVWFSRIEARPAFVKAARQWYERLLKSQTPEGSIFGAFPGLIYAHRSVYCAKNLSFLEGSSGVGLSLMAAVDPAQPGSWEEILGLPPFPFTTSTATGRIPSPSPGV